jgi:hypothetical protein
MIQKMSVYERDAINYHLNNISYLLMSNVIPLFDAVVSLITDSVVVGSVVDNCSASDVEFPIVACVVVNSS